MGAMMTHAMPLHPLPLDELSGWIVGALAPKVAATAVVVVDLDDDSGWDAPPIHDGLPAVVVGTTAHPSPEDHPAAVACDAVVGAGEAALDRIVATVARNPEASRSFVQVLRRTPPLDVDEGLEVESHVYSALQGGREFQRWLAGRTRAARRPEGDPVRLERQGGHLEVVLQRPHVRNALSAAMQQALCDAMAIAADPAIATVDLRGDGPDFCSGGDLDEFGTFESPEAAHRLRLERSVGRGLAAVAGKVTAHLHGACAGSGIELPAFAARVLAAPDTRISLPELSLGLIPGAGGTVSLPARIGRHRTARLGLVGEPIDAATALAWGLVDEVVDDEGGR
jgi:enoyl-CoA hydratase/carnithine racemase